MNKGFGKIIAKPQGYEIIRFRRSIAIHCPCGKGIVGEFYQRGKSRLQDYCYHCFKQVPRKEIITILKDRGFKGVSL